MNLARKRAKLGLLDKITPAKLPSSFPSDGFLEEVSLLPEINYGVIWRYMIETCDGKKQLSTAKPLVKGFNFFKSGHVLSIQCQKLNDHLNVKSQVLPSMKKTKAYSRSIVLDVLSQVVRAYEGCPAGIDGRCNHVAATLFALEALKEKAWYPVHQNRASGIFHANARLKMW